MFHKRNWKQAGCDDVLPVCHATAGVPMLEQCAGADHPNYTRIPSRAAQREEQDKSPTHLAIISIVLGSVRLSPSAGGSHRGSILNAEKRVIG
jgi:hypothetical protein